MKDAPRLMFDRRVAMVRRLVVKEIIKMGDGLLR
jgi:hypothetical protein